MSSGASSTSKKPASKVTSPRKGKEKQKPVASEDTPMDEDVEEEDDEEDDDDEEEEEDADEEMEEDDEEEDNMEEIDPTAIKSRRTRGIKVDYTSPEALAKAGLQRTDLDKDEDDE